MSGLMYRTIPDEVTGYPLDPFASWWSVIVAERSSNMIVNPSFEKVDNLGAVSEYDAGGTWDTGDIADNITDSSPVGVVAGRRCAVLTGGIGIGRFDYVGELSVSPGYYTFSLDVFCSTPGSSVVLSVRDGSTVLASQTKRISRSAWMRVHITYKELGSGTRTLRLSSTNGSSVPITFYTDAWQFENKPYPTTYLDGDMVGFYDLRPNDSFYWHGEPHASASSRKESTGSGGRLISWSDEVGFLTTAVTGLMMPPYTQMVQVLGSGRGNHLSVREEARDFTVSGVIMGTTYSDLKRRYKDFTHLFRPNNTNLRDEMLIRYFDGDSDSDPMYITCVYKEGLQGSINNLYQARVAVQFSAVQPFPVSVRENSQALVMSNSLVSNMVVHRDDLGEYMNLGTGETTGGIVHRVGFLNDGRMVAFGNYTQIAGDAADYGAIWDGSNWQEIPSTDSGITDIDDGFKVGYPLTVSTVGADVLEYDPVAETWAALGTGFTGSINELQRDDKGDIWVAGRFEFAQDGVTVFNNVAKWNSEDEVWEQIGEGVTDPPDVDPATLEALTVLVTNDGNVYFGGTFSRGESGATTTLASRVIRWDIERQIYRALGTGLNEAPNKLIQGRDGFIYAVGPFSQDGTENYDLRGFARWNGYSWEEVFPLVRPGGIYGADGVIQDEDEVFWFYNVVTDEETDLFDVEGLGRVPFFGWRNGVFYPPYFLDGSISNVAIGPGNKAIYAVRAYAGAEVPIKAPAMNIVDYGGSADCPIVINIKGPGRVMSIVNHSTEGGLYATDKFLVTAFEHVVFRNDTSRAMVYSNQKRNIHGKILDGATNFSALRLMPGENRVNVFVPVTEAGSEAWMTWRERYLGIGDSV